MIIRVISVNLIFSMKYSHYNCTFIKSSILEEYLPNIIRLVEIYLNTIKYYFHGFFILFLTGIDWWY